MKKTLILISVFLLAYQFSNAQTAKGTQTLGLDLQYLHTNTTSVFNNSGSAQTQKNSSSTFSIAPTYGYFIANGSEIGGSLSFYTNTNNNTTENFGPGSFYNLSSNKQTSNLYGVSVFFRKYVLYKNQVGFRAGPYAGYSGGTTTYTSTGGFYDGKNTNKQYNVGANLDLVYYPSTKLGITLKLANLAYTNYDSKGTSPNQNKSENFSFSFVNSGVGVSVFYVIGAK